MYEFGEYIKRNELETYLTSEQQRLVFDFIETKHNGAVPVKDFLKAVEEHEFRDHEMNKEAQKIRDFLAFHVDQRRAEETNTAAPNSNNPSHATLPPIDEELREAMKKKGIENEAERIRRALGMKTFDLDIDHKEFNEVLDEVYFKKLPTNEMHRKYARFLHHSNLKLSQVPYYDIRSRELDRLKHRAAMIDRILEGADMKGRYVTLSESRANLLNHRVNNAFLHTSHSSEDLKNAVDVSNYDFDKYDDPDTFTHTVASPGPSPGSSPSRSLTQTKVLSRPRTSPDDSLVGPDPRASSPAERVLEEREKVHSRLGLSRSLPNLNLSARPSPLAALDLTNVHPIADAKRQQNFRDLSGAQAVADSPSRKKAAAKQAEEGSILTSSQKHGVFISDVAGEKDQDRDLTSVKSAVTASSLQSSANLSKASGATSVPSSKKSKLISELLQPQEGALKESDFYMSDVSTSMGRLKDPSKIVRIEKIDPNVYASKGKRIISQGPSDWSRVGLGGDVSEPDDQFLTTSSRFFPPLLYEPSQPVSRNLVSEADLAFKKKEFVRNQRYQRTQANLEITRQRIEAEQLEKQMRSLRREASRIEDSIRYKTSVMLNDLYNFKQQPLQRMAKRQNIHLADRMWGGSQEKQTVVLVPENRDFHTTYSSSFLHTSDSDQPLNHTTATQVE